MILLAKVTIVFAGALIAAALARRATAATRHAILIAAQLAVLIVPAIVPIVPPVRVNVGPALARTAPVTRVTPLAADAPAHGANIPLLPLVWIAGTAAILASRMTALARAIRIVRRARTYDDGFAISADIDQPATLGTRILLPRNALNWDAERLEAVLRHERAHVARHDFLALAIGEITCAIWWFHPLAWIVARRAALERERACDDAVVDDGIDPIHYATALLDAARATRGLPLATAMASRTHLDHRIRGVLDGATPRRGGRASVLVVALCTALALPAVAALAPLIPRPKGIEPDLLFEPWSGPLSERVEGVPASFRVESSDPLIVRLNEIATVAPRAEDDLVPERARWVLMQTRGGDLVPPLVAALRHGDWRIRCYAAWGLGIAGDRRSTAALMPLLEDRIWRVRAMAAFALANIADPSAAEVMTRALADEAWQVRTPAVHYLDAIGHRAALEPMLEDRHIAVRMAAEEALGRRR